MCIVVSCCYFVRNMNFLRENVSPRLRGFQGKNMCCGFYEEECLIYNPYFRVPETSCELCSYVKEIEERSQYADLDVNNPAQPFINRQALGQPVTFEDLRTAYKENAEKLQASVMNFRSNEMSLRSFKDLFAVNSPVELQKQIGDMFHTEYVSRKVAGAQVLRRLFHRPHFVPAETEVALEKFVFVDGPKAKPYKFSLAQFSNVWYAQGQGSRRLILLPSVNCLGECKKFEITLKERDILFYSDEFWRASSYPVPQSQEISIAFKGSFF
ncbi:uncharacterized protein LOC106150413 isoform X2 [Lingula anatina]|uniref:Uncharacterized protein LOC106150413 isoform X2 n=1 Tax=Lingula anatina TaxID=7574 RepID=A0A1S3GXR0_LINAN|nr:uncharacterized protein LOC106150413 isoform X2 [Lingula anatina]|eukprot:XP_013378650.1 uncharacterized protein LOC106150413 isoform X2 [Lingula anatina]